MQNYFLTTHLYCSTLHKSPLSIETCLEVHDMRYILILWVMYFTASLYAQVAPVQGQVVNETLCERPDFGGKDTSRSTLMWRGQKATNHNYVKDYHKDLKHDFSKNVDSSWLSGHTLVIGQFDQKKRTPPCIAKSYDLYTDNEQELALELVKPTEAVCSATVTYTDNPARDYGAVAQNLVTGVIGKIAAIDGGAGVVSTIVLPSAGVKNTTAAVVLSCKESDKKDAPTVGTDRKLNIHYGNVDLVSASAGAIVSTLGKKIYGIKTSTVGKNADGTDKTVSKIAVTSASNAQLVPIGLVNLNYAGNRKVNFNGQVGLGINPNGSSTQVEYFVSPLAIGWKGLYIAPGVHIARSERLAGGFALGDTVSSSSFSVPALWTATYRLGFTISYQPLPKK